MCILLDYICLQTLNFLGTFQQCVDLSPLYFHTWGHLKTQVYAALIEKEETLRQRIFDACRTNHNRPITFKRVLESKIRYVHAGNDSG